MMTVPCILALEESLRVKRYIANIIPTSGIRTEKTYPRTIASVCELCDWGLEEGFEGATLARFLPQLLQNFASSTNDSPQLGQYFVISIT